MNMTQKIISLCAMAAIFVYDRITKQAGINFYLGLLVLVAVAGTGIYLLRDKKGQNKSSKTKKEEK